MPGIGYSATGSVWEGCKEDGMHAKTGSLPPLLPVLPTTASAKHEFKGMTSCWVLSLISKDTKKAPGGWCWGYFSHSSKIPAIHQQPGW